METYTSLLVDDPVPLIRQLCSSSISGSLSR